VIAACYHRNSTAGQIGNYSQQEAERRLPQVARANGFAQVEFHLEAGVSGEELHNRPVLQAILHRIERGEIGALVCQDHTRLARDRDLIDGQLIKQVCRRADCLIIDEQKVYDLRIDADDLTSDVQFLGAKIQKRQNLRGIVRGLEEEALRTGMVTRRRQLVGYDRRTALIDGRARRVQFINSHEAKLVRRIYRLALEHGMRGVASLLNADRATWRPVKEAKQQLAMATRWGGDGTRRPWWAQDIKEICSNPLYRGVARWAKPEHERPGQRPRSDLMAHVNNVMVEHSELRIVAADLWFRVQETLAQRAARFASRSVGSSFLYSGLLRCPYCGGRMHGCRSTTDRHGGRTAAYRCAEWAARGRHICRGFSIHEKAVSSGLIPYLASVMPAEDIEGAIDRTLSADRSELDHAQRDRGRRAIAELRRRLENLRVSLEVTSDREEHLRKESRIAEIKDEIVRHQEALQQQQARRADQESAAEVLGLLGKIGEVDLLERLARDQPPLFQRLVRTVFQSVTIASVRVGRGSEGNVLTAEYTDAFARLRAAVNRRDPAAILSAGEQFPALTVSA
jgi:site-specific DNA recombinase